MLGLTEPHPQTSNYPLHKCFLVQWLWLKKKKVCALYSFVCVCMCVLWHVCGGHGTTSGPGFLLLPCGSWEASRGCLAASSSTRWALSQVLLPLLFWIHFYLLLKRYWMISSLKRTTIITKPKRINKIKPPHAPKSPEILTGGSCLSVKIRLESMTQSVNAQNSF